MLAGLRTQFVARNIVSKPQVDSTNELAKRLAARRVPEGTLVIAEEQRAGKGRRGRRWLAPPGTSLLMSYIFYPRLEPREATRLTMAASWAAAEAIEQVTGLEVRLKWPNDILVQGKKAGGVLTETGITGERLDYAVVGIGLNVNFRMADLPELADTATSLMESLGGSVSRLELLWAFSSHLEEAYGSEGDFSGIQSKWAARLETLGKPVQIDVGDRKINGLAEAVDENGALQLRTADDSRIVVSIGEVS